MSTKENPSRFDGNAAALPDEPRFTLLARDPLAHILVSIWSSCRYGDLEAAEAKFWHLLKVTAERYPRDPDVEKASDALEIGMAMFEWRKANDGRWRGKQPDEQPLLYPAELTPALRDVLGMPNFRLHPVWLTLRAAGREIRERYEDEMAAALHFLVPFALRHGPRWGAAAEAELARLREQAETSAPCAGDGE